MGIREGGERRGKMERGKRKEREEGFRGETEKKDGCMDGAGCVEWNVSSKSKRGRGEALTIGILD